ncbi:MAG: thiazole synthase, partial [Acetobacteraceae bacterium]|nr:thiazole synthase [Acetobacteraceae bacterium]
MSDTDDDCWQVAGQRFQSRLIVGTGRYKDLDETAAAIEASGAEIVTVAVRRVNLSDPKAPMLQDYV